MGHKFFISYKKEDLPYKDELVALFEEADVIDKTLDRVIDSDDEITFEVNEVLRVVAVEGVKLICKKKS